MKTKNALGLICTGLITIGFFVAGVFEVLDYFIIKALLFSAFLLILSYVGIIIAKSENKNHLK
jgi:hypothetical protein